MAHESAVDEEGLAADVAGGVGGEPDGQGSHLLFPAGASHGDEADQPAGLGVGAAQAGRVLHPGGGDAVDGDIVGSPLLGQGPRQVDDAPLGGAIGGAVSKAPLAQPRSDGDDAAARGAGGAPVLPQHLAAGGAAGGEDGAEGQVQDAGPLGGRRLVGGVG